MAILEEIASNIFSFKKMSLMDKEKLNIAVETHYRLDKTKGKLQTFTAYKNGGVNKGTTYRWLLLVNSDILSKYQNKLQSSIIKMMDGLPLKLMKAQSEGLNSVLKYNFFRSKSNLVKFLW